MKRQAAKLAGRLLLVLLLAISLSGCMYGNQIKQQGAPASGEYIALVQNAMDQYLKKNGILPIRNKEQVMTEYERYLIDFKKLQDARLLTTVPVNAFENGGSAVYVVANTDVSPVVKLMDLVSYQEIVSMQRAVDTYKASHDGRLPLGEAVAEGFWEPDYRALNMKRQGIRSPYSPIELFPIMNADGIVALDYAPELQRVVEKMRKAGKEPAKDEDLRDLLVEDGIYVPAVSFPYRWSGTAPVPVRDETR